MPDTVTSNYGWVKPEITGSPSTWGNKWNSNLDLIDAAIFATNAQFTNYIRFDTGGTLTQPVHCTAADGGGNQLITHDQVVALILNYLPVGVISLWSGSIGTIPAHWALCNGSSGTPDLRDKFVVGSGITYDPGVTGGSANSTPTITVNNTTLNLTQIPIHNHGINDPGHTHGITDNGHSHTINEQLGANGTGATQQIPFGAGSPVASTNVSGTGISINAAATNVTIQNAGGGQPHNHTASSSAVPTLPPYMGLAYIMRV